MLFDFLIYTFSLTIWLRVVCSDEGVGDAHPLIKCFHESRSELQSLVGDNLGWNSIKLEDFVVVNICDTFCIYTWGGWENVHLFTVMINIHHNGIIPFNKGETSNEIHTNCLPGAFWNVVRLKCGARVSGRLSPLTVITSCDILFLWKWPYWATNIGNLPVLKFPFAQGVRLYLSCDKVVQLFVEGWAIVECRHGLKRTLVRCIVPSR